MYTLREFRMNTKQAFDDSFAGHEVTIKRGNQKFQLICLVDKPLAGHSFESIPNKEPKIIKTPEQAKEIIGTHIDTKKRELTIVTCKIHGTVMDARGRCLQKGCKYA